MLDAPIQIRIVNHAVDAQGAPWLCMDVTVGALTYNARAKWTNPGWAVPSVAVGSSQNPRRFERVQRAVAFRCAAMVLGLGL